MPEAGAVKASGADDQQDPPPEQEKPAPPPPIEDKETQDRAKERSTLDQEAQALNQHLTDLFNQGQKDQEEAQKMAPYLEKLKQSLDAPLPDPPPVRPPPMPPQQQGNLATSLFNLFKFGGLMVIAGLATKGRGRFHGAIQKAALAGAINGWNEGQKETRDAGLKAYEQNNASWKEYNQEQQQHYKDILEERRLGLQSKMDLFKAYGEYYGNKRTQAAAERSDIRALVDSVNAQRKVLDDADNQARKDRPTLYKALGKDAEGYASWVRMKGGPIITDKTPAGDLAELEKTYPWHDYVDYTTEQEKKKQDIKEAEGEKRQEQRDIAAEQRQAEREAGAEKRQVEREKEAERVRKEKEAETAPVDLNKPLPPDVNKQWRAGLFNEDQGAGSD
jgi:hypothetical protein